MSSVQPCNLAISKTEFSANGLPEILRAKYKLRILWDLQNGWRRFGEIRKRLILGVEGSKSIAPRVLSRELKSLAGLGLVQRRAYNVIPPRVEYRLTALGRSLLPVISKILEWGTRHPSRNNGAKGASVIRSESTAASPVSSNSPVNEAVSYADR